MKLDVQELLLGDAEQVAEQHSHLRISCERQLSPSAGAPSLAEHHQLQRAGATLQRAGNS
jgi:hypothetical protein